MTRNPNPTRTLTHDARRWAFVQSHIACETVCESFVWQAHEVGTSSPEREYSYGYSQGHDRLLYCTAQALSAFSPQLSDERMSVGVAWPGTGTVSAVWRGAGGVPGGATRPCAHVARAHAQMDDAPTSHVDCHGTRKRKARAV